MAALAFAACNAPSVVIIPRVSRLDIGGDFGAEQGSSVTSSASVDSLGLQADSSVLGGRVDLEAAGHWTFSAQQSTHDGQGIADAQLSSGGSTIDAGDPVASELDFGVYSGAVTFDVLPSDAVELGFGLGVAALDVKARFTDLSSSEVVSTDEVLPVPFLAGRLGFDLGAFEVSGLVAWMQADFDGSHTSYLDFDGMARVRVFGDSDRVAGYFAFGYRFVSVSAEYENSGDAFDVDLDFDGPWVGLALSF